jgi:hypothetical protein
MRKRHFKEFFVIINTKDFSVSLCQTNIKAAEIIGVHRDTIASVSERRCINDFIIENIREQ